MVQFTSTLEFTLSFLIKTNPLLLVEILLFICYTKFVIQMPFVYLRSGHSPNISQNRGIITFIWHILSHALYFF